MELSYRSYTLLCLMKIIIEISPLTDSNNLPLPSLYHLSMRNINFTEWVKEKQNIAQEVLVFDSEIYELRHKNMSIYWFIDYDTPEDINIIPLNEVNHFLLTRQNVTSEEAWRLVTRRSGYHTQKYILRNGCHAQWDCGGSHDVSCSKELCLLKDVDFKAIEPVIQVKRIYSTHQPHKIDPTGKDYVNY